MAFTTLQAGSLTSVKLNNTNIPDLEQPQWIRDFEYKLSSNQNPISLQILIYPNSSLDFIHSTLQDFSKHHKRKTTKKPAKPKTTTTRHPKTTRKRTTRKPTATTTASSDTQTLYKTVTCVILILLSYLIVFIIH